MFQYLRNLSPAQITDGLALLSLAALFWVGMNYVNLNIGGIGVQVPYNIFAWIACSIFILTALLRIMWLGQLRLHRSTYYYFGFILLLFFPLVYADKLFLSVEALRFAGMAAGLLFLVGLQQFASDIFNTRLIKLVFISTLIQTTWGLLQYYFIFEPSRLFYRADYGIPYGVFQQVNVFAVYLAFGSLLSLFLWSNATKTYLSRLVLPVGLLLFFNAHLTVLSNADTAKITGGLSVICYLIYLRTTGVASKWLLVLFVALMAGYLAPKSWFDIRPAKQVEIVSAADLSSVRESGDHASGSRTYSEVGSETHELSQSAAASGELETSPLAINSPSNMLGTRPTIYAVSMKMFLDEFWMGHGIGSFRKQYLLYQGNYLRENPGVFAEFNLHHPHNEILYWAIELGALTLLAFLGLLWAWVKMVRLAIIRLNVLLVASPLILQSLVELPFYHSVPHFLGFMVILAASSVPADMYRYQIPKLVSLFTLAGGLWLTFKAWVFLLSTYYALQMFIQFNLSGREEIAYLFNINNPAAFQQRYEFELFQWKLRQANELGEVDLQDLNNFLIWSYSVVQYAPLAGIYESFVSSLIIGKKYDAAQLYLDEGLLMYPASGRLAALQLELNSKIKSD